MFVFEWIPLFFSCSYRNKSSWDNKHVGYRGDFGNKGLQSRGVSLYIVNSDINSTGPGKKFLKPSLNHCAN